MKLISALTTCATLMGLASTTYAQNQRVDLTPAQIRHANEAAQLLSQSPPDAKKALVAVDKAFKAGPGTALLWLTKARSLQFLDQCEQSKIALSRVKSAPRAKGIKESIIEQRVKLYTDDMALRCSGYLTLQCTNPATQIEIDGKNHFCGAPKKLSPGNHKIVATLGDQKKTFDVAIKGEQTLNIPIAMQGAANNNNNTVVKPLPQPKTEGSYTPTIITGVSALVLSGATWIWFVSAKGNSDDLVNEYNKERDCTFEGICESTQFPREPFEVDNLKTDAEDAKGTARLALGTAIGVTVAGAAVTAIVYMLTGPKEAKTAEPSQTGNLQLWTSPDGAGATWTMEF